MKYTPRGLQRTIVGLVKCFQAKVLMAVIFQLQVRPDKRKRFSGVEGRTRGTPSTPAHLHICLLLGNTGRTASGMFIQFDLVSGRFWWPK